MPAEEPWVDPHDACLGIACLSDGAGSMLFEFDAGQQRAGHGQEHPTQFRIRRALRHVGTAIRQQPLEFRGHLRAFICLGRRPPAGQQRSGGDRPARAQCVGFRCKIPDGGVAAGVGMRIRGEDVRRHVLRQIPFPVAGADREVDSGEIATGVAVACSHEQTDGVAAPQRDLLERADRRPLAGCARAADEHLSGAAAPDLQRPDCAVAAPGMRGLDRSRYPRGAREPTPPADDQPLLRVGMHRHAVGLHRAGDPQLLVRRVGEDPQVPIASPTVDRLPSLDPFELRVEEFWKLRFRRADAQIREPRRQQPRLDGVLPRHVGDSCLECVGCHLRSRGGGLRRGRKALRRSRGERVSLRRERGSHPSQEPQRQVGPPGSHQPRVLPDDEVVVVTIAGVSAAEADRHHILVFIPVVNLVHVPLRQLELDAKLLPVHQRRHRFHPRSRSVGPAEPPRDLAYLVESPERCLPARDAGGDRGGVARPRCLPAGSQGAEQRRRLPCRRRAACRSGGTRERLPERGQIFRTQAPFTGHLGNRVASLRETIPLGQCHQDVFLRGQKSVVPRVELDPLLHDRLRRSRRRVERLGEPPVELADAAERLVGPVAPRVAR